MNNLGAILDAHPANAERPHNELSHGFRPRTRYERKNFLAWRVGLPESYDCQ